MQTRLRVSTDSTLAGLPYVERKIASEWNRYYCFSTIYTAKPSIIVAGGSYHFFLHVRGRRGLLPITSFTLPVYSEVLTLGSAKPTAKQVDNRSSLGVTLIQRWAKSPTEPSRNRSAARPSTAIFPRAENHFARSCARVVALIDDDSSIHQHVGHPFGILLRFLVGSRIGDRVWVEDHDVGPITFLEQAPVLQSQRLRRQ